MRRILGVLLVGALGLAGCRKATGVNAPVSVVELVGSSELDADEVSMREIDDVPRVGDVYTDTELSHSEQLGTFTAASGGQARLLLERRESSVTRTEVLGVRAGGVTRFRITFLELAIVQKTNATPTRGKMLPKLQKPYVIDVSVEPTAVTDDKGTEVAGEERDAVLRQVTIAYKVQALEDARDPGGARGPAEPPRHTVRPGDAAPWVQAALERRLSYDTLEAHTEARVPTSKVIELREVEGKACAVIEVAIQSVTTGTDERRIGTEVRGQALVRAEDGQILALAVKGPTQVHMNLELDDGESVVADAMGKVRSQLARVWAKRGAP